MEAMKHIEEIREKLEAIDTFRKKQKEMKEVMEQEEKEREKLFAKKEEWMDVQEKRRCVMNREIIEHEILEEKTEVC